VYPIDYFWRSAARDPGRIAVLAPDTALSYGALASLVRRRAVGLLRLAPRSGDPVCIGGANSVDHLVALLAALAAEKIWVPLNPRNGDGELRRIVEFVGPSAIVADEALAKRLGGAGPIARLAELDGDEDEWDARSRALRRTARDLGTTQAIKFTGGTTGTPKGVQQPLRAWNANIVTQIHEIGLSARDRYLVAAPLTHGTSTYVLPTLATGGALVFPDGSKAEQLLDAAGEHDATFTFAPPTLIQMLAMAQSARPRSLKALRCLIYGGAPMRVDQIAMAHDAFGQCLAATFGQTEAPQIAAWLSPAEMIGGRILSAGRPSLMTEIAILDPAGAPLPIHGEGEIAIRGDLVMTGYFKAPEETRQVLQNGWLRTGDVGALDEDGFLFIRDRLRDVIITGGFNVYPSDVEAALGAHPAVLDCSVVGIPDDKWGEAVHAAVQPADARAWDPRPVLDALRAELGSVKAPKALHLFDTLPRSPVGKIQKSAIRDEIRARLTGGLPPERRQQQERERREDAQHH
jgi:fatty-acyl-CoA synthase